MSEKPLAKIYAHSKLDRIVDRDKRLIPDDVSDEAQDSDEPKPLSDERERLMEVRNKAMADIEMILKKDPDEEAMRKIKEKMGKLDKSGLRGTDDVTDTNK